jgi:hypothetical protein
MKGCEYRAFRRFPHYSAVPVGAVVQTSVRPGAVVSGRGEGKLLRQRGCFLTLGNEHFKQVRFERK